MTGTFDINLTPDKRTILLHEEQSLIKELSVHSPTLSLISGPINPILRFIPTYSPTKSIPYLHQTPSNRTYKTRKS